VSACQSRANHHRAGADSSGFQRGCFRMATRKRLIHAVPDALCKSEAAGSNPARSSQERGDLQELVPARSKHKNTPCGRGVRADRPIAVERGRVSRSVSRCRVTLYNEPACHTQSDRPCAYSGGRPAEFRLRLSGTLDAAALVPARRMNRAAASDRLNPPRQQQARTARRRT
jgi:hypothetical protein